MLLKDHLLDAKIFIDVVSSTRHPRTMWGRSSSSRIEVIAHVLLKSISFLLNQITQYKADAPTKIFVHKLFINLI
jgi:hypothetical protein